MAWGSLWVPAQELTGCFPCLLHSGFQVAQEDDLINLFFISPCSKVQISPISGTHSRTDALMVHCISCQVLSQESCSWGTWGCGKLTSKLFLLLFVMQLTWCRKQAWGPWKCAQQSPSGTDWGFYFLGKAEILHVNAKQVLVHLFGLQNHHFPFSSASQATYNVKQNQSSFNFSTFPNFSIFLYSSFSFPLFSLISFSLYPNQQHLFVPCSFSNPTSLPFLSVILFFPWLVHVSKPHQHSTSSELQRHNLHFSWELSCFSFLAFQLI